MKYVKQDHAESVRRELLRGDRYAHVEDDEHERAYAEAHPEGDDPTEAERMRMLEDLRRELARWDRKGYGEGWGEPEVDEPEWSS